VAHVTLRRLWVALGLLGAGLLVPFEEPVPVALGVVCLIAFVGVGLAVIASPAFTRGDEAQEVERSSGG
jgi:hypothetical protein